MRRLNASDMLLRDGRLALAYQGYLDLLREFPTWWLPTVKAGVAARALRLPESTVSGYLDRAATLLPTGTYLSFVRALDRAGQVDLPSPTSDDPLADRAGLLRARRLVTAGRTAEAVSEYRFLLGRSPHNVQARWRLVRILRSQGRADEAATLLREGEKDSLFPPRWRAASTESAREPRKGVGRD
jgi:tetratricopeptide (TPR) repeat protein